MFKDGYELEHSQDTRTNCEQNKNVLFRLTTIGTGEISCTRASGLIRGSECRISGYLLAWEMRKQRCKENVCWICAPLHLRRDNYQKASCLLVKAHYTLDFLGYKRISDRLTACSFFPTYTSTRHYVLSTLRILLKIYII